MRNFAIKFSKYTTYDAPKGTPNRGERVLSQPINITAPSFGEAYQYACLRLSGMRDADPVNTYAIAAVVAPPSVSGKVAVMNGGMFELDGDSE